MKLHRIIIPFITIFIFMAIGCSDDDSTTNSQDDDGIVTTQKKIGPLGDTLSIPGKIMLVVPPGALDDSVTISITQNNTPAPVAAPNRFLCPVFSLEPSGTEFNVAAYISLNYDVSKLGQASENDIVLCCDTGNAIWDTVSSILDFDENKIGAYLEHLSDYVALVDTTTPFSVGVFAAISISRNISKIGEFVFKTDGIAARFDSSYAPCDTVKPIKPDSVHCNEYKLAWNSDLKRFQYGFNVLQPPFLVIENPYEVSIFGNTYVPTMVETIDFPSCEPTLISPEYGETVSKSGFDVTWRYLCLGNVRLILMSESDSVIWVEVPNDGSYSFSDTQLSSLEPGEYGLLMIFENYKYIDAEGYDPRSFIMARVINTSIIYLEE